VATSVDPTLATDDVSVGIIIPLNLHLPTRLRTLDRCIFYEQSVVRTPEV
jgi:hypothetical protein